MNTATRNQGRPALAPDYLIEIAGQTISPELGGRLMQLSFADRRGLQSDQLDITLANHDNQLLMPARGVELSLAIGWRGQGLIDKGTFVVDEAEHAGSPDRLVIRARAADMRNALPGKRSQSWHQTTLLQVVNDIAARHGLAARISPELGSVFIQHIDQTDESDLNLLTRLAARYDADTTIKAGQLLFLPQGGGRTAGGTEIQPVFLYRHAGDSHRYVASDRQAYTGVIAWWHDVATAERKSVLVGSDINPKSLRGNQASEADAQAEASAEWNRSRRAGSSFTVDLAAGIPELYPETPIVAQGWPVDIDDVPWVVVEVSHTISDSAYTSSVSMEVMGAALFGDEQEAEIVAAL